MDKKSKLIKIILITLPVSIFIILLTVFFTGPKVHLDKKIKKYKIPRDIKKLDEYIYKNENKVKNLKKDTEKKIIWANNKKTKTNYSIIYIHGFSATRREISPVVEELGKKLTANIFFTRLKAHGRDKDAYINVKANVWLNDANEAVEVGKIIGDKLIIITSSTGSILTIDISINEPAVKAVILISPNFGLYDKRSNIVFLPWGKTIAKIFHKNSYFKFTSESKEDEYYWSKEYHINGFFEMMSLIKYSKKIKYKKLTIPCLFIYTENDKIINTKNVLEIYNKIGSKTKRIINIKEANKHVLTGDIKSPHTTKKIINTIYEYLLINL